MIQIIEKEFQMVQTSGPFFDLYMLTKINEGKENEREEMKLTDYGIPFDACLKKIINYKILDKDYTVKEYVEAYAKAVKELESLVQYIDKSTKQEIDG